MKLKIAVLLIAIATLSAAPLVRAQQTPVATTNAFTGLWNSFSGWALNPDTNNTTLSTTLYRVETGPAIQSGMTISDNVFLQRNFSAGGKLALASETRNASIAGTIVSEEVGLAYNLYQKYDTEVTPFVLGGYRFDKDQMVGSLGVVVRHMLNKVAYVAPGVQLDFAKKPTPMITVSAGFAF